MTVGQLREIIDGVQDYVWVCLKDGPVVKHTKELGASEPFLLLETASGCSMHGRLNDPDCSMCKDIEAEVLGLPNEEDALNQGPRQADGVGSNPESRARRRQESLTSASATLAGDLGVGYGLTAEQVLALITDFNVNFALRTRSIPAEPICSTHGVTPMLAKDCPACLAAVGATIDPPLAWHDAGCIKRYGAINDIPCACELRRSHGN